MKRIGKLSLALNLVLVLLGGCSKSDENSLVVDDNFMKGKWEISSILLPSGLEYPYLQKGDILYFEDSKNVELISKMILPQTYFIDVNNQTFEFSSVLAPLGKFDLKVINEERIKIIPQMFKGKISLVLDRKASVQEADLLGKWQLKSMIAYSIQNDREVVEDVMATTPAHFTDDIFEFKVKGEVTVWDNLTDLKENTTASYEINGNTLLLTITQTNRNPYVQTMKIVSVSENDLIVKSSEIDGDVLITTTNTFAKVK